MRLIRHLVLLLLLVPLLGHAQVGTVVSVQGTALVERAGKPARILGAGEPLEQKDVINVAQGSNAILEFTDKTRITLRPNTVFRVESYSAAQGPAQGMVMGLSKGGFRAVTGEIGKQNPASVRFQTDNVVLGIRGTEFDARLCEDDCAGEDRPRPAIRAIARAVGRVIEVNGTVTTDGKDQVARELVAGAVVNEGETLAAAPGADALVLFRDGTRVTLKEASRLAVTQFDYDEAHPGKGQARLKLLSGAAHVYTGALAKIGPDAFVFETSAGVIRTVGAGFSVGTRKGSGPTAQRPLHYADARGGSAQTRTDALQLAAALGEDVFVVHTWDGTIVIQTAIERIEVPKESTLVITVVDGKVQFLQSPPPFLTSGQRPDQASIDPSTFGPQTLPPERGLYVWVREGAVTLAQGGQVVELKEGHAARITEKIAMLGAVPNFMRFDFTPRPGGIIPPQIPRSFRAPDGSITGMCR